MSTGQTILQIKGLNKYFGPTHANKNIDFSVKSGEIHGLIGENGSGKSTLISQIAGIYPHDSGEMILKGEPYNPSSPVDANNHKISMVMQELGVVGTLSAGMNVFLGRTDKFTKFGIIDMKRLNKEAEAIFEKWDLPRVPLNKMTDGMMIETRKMIELARALSVDPDILILDEITQSLSLNNRKKLIDLINKLKEEGRSIIVITHDVEELIEITDTITVLRDGEVVGNVISAETNPDQIKQMMVGRAMEGDYYRDDMIPDYNEDEVVMTVRDVSVKGEIEDISFDLHKGEILGFCGLSDSGIHSVGKAVYGLSKKEKGTVHLVEKNVDIKTAPQALRSNMGYVPKDRDNEALMIHTSIRDNTVLPSQKELQGPAAYLSPARLSKLALKTSEQLSVKSTGINQNLDALSGGNKQKVNFGRWLAKDLKILILDCPTRGVDVGVKAYIYSLMKQAKKEGISIVLISDELTEILGMSDRLFVMKDGKITKEIRRDEDFTEQSVIGVMI